MDFGLFLLLYHHFFMQFIQDVPQIEVPLDDGFDPVQVVEFVPNVLVLDLQLFHQG